MASSISDNKFGRKGDVTQVRHDVELQAARRINISIDLVAAAKQNLKFLRIVAGLPHLHSGPAVYQAIRRYRDYWMPLATQSSKAAGAADRNLVGETLVPPLDVRWVWHCHCLHPKAYQEFCILHYSKIIDVPSLLDVASEVAAQERCRKIWAKLYPHEPFDLETLDCGSFGNHPNSSPINQINSEDDIDLVATISTQSSFYYQVKQPYMSINSFLKLARERYKCFLYILQKSEGRFKCVPTVDINLMWRTHKLFPLEYAQDTRGALGSVVFHDYTLDIMPDRRLVDSFHSTARLWEDLFGNPYERAGSVYHRMQLLESVSPLEAFSESIPVTINWQYQDFDINSKLETLHPRYVLEVCIQIQNADKGNYLGEEANLFVRLCALEAHKLLKLETPLARENDHTSWQKLWLMQCEISTKGVILELRSPIQGCFKVLKSSKLVGDCTLTWKELEESPLLTVDKTFVFKKGSNASKSQNKTLHLTICASITPPVQAPYLLKSVPDCVTDDSGAMLSKVILRMNKYQPQQGRWISRTVFDHGGKECFVIRIRVAKGMWRRKLDRPVGVDWNERVIQIHEGGWTYLAGSVCQAPEKMVAAATPVADELEQYRMRWVFSTGETLTIQMPIEEMEWERHLRISLKCSHPGSVRLLNGRQMQYQVPTAVPEEEEGFVTMVRYTTEDPQGKATALFNWKVSAMEILPEEDVVLVMLLCTATMRTVADLSGKSMGNSYIRRRRKGSQAGKKDWGSIVLGGGPEIPSDLTFWYLNPEEVVGDPLSELPGTGSGMGSPKWSNNQMYRGTSWLYAGETGGLYKVSSKGSSENFGRDRTGSVFGGLTLVRWSSQQRQQKSVSAES